MVISEEKVKKDIIKILKDKEKTKELARTLENNYRSLYHSLNAIEEWEPGTHIRDGYMVIMPLKKEEGRTEYSIKVHGSHNKVKIVIDKNAICIKDSSDLFFSYAKGNFEHLLEAYSKSSLKGEVANRIIFLIQAPAAILREAEEKHKELEKERESGGLEALLQKSKLNTFDIELLKKNYHSNPETFKQLFELSNEDLKKETIQALIKQREANREIDNWIEEEYKQLAEEAGMEQFIGQK